MNFCWLKYLLFFGFNNCLVLNLLFFWLIFVDTFILFILNYEVNNNFEEIVLKDTGVWKLEMGSVNCVHLFGSGFNFDLYSVERLEILSAWVNCKVRWGLCQERLYLHVVISVSFALQWGQGQDSQLSDTRSC